MIQFVSGYKSSDSNLAWQRSLKFRVLFHFNGQFRYSVHFVQCHLHRIGDFDAFNLLIYQFNDKKKNQQNNNKDNSLSGLFLLSLKSQLNSTKCKGQFISKNLSVSWIPPKNKRKNLTYSNMIPQVDLFSFVFLEELKKPKSPFEINGPLLCLT